MNRGIVGLLLSALALAWCGPSFGEDISWVGATSNDATVGSNWSTANAPAGADRAIFRSGTNGTPDLGANNVTWDRMAFNGGGATTLSGSGTITLNGAGGNPVIFSDGGPLESTIHPNVTTTGIIQSNGNHNLVFNGTVNTKKIEAFNSQSTYNGNVTVTGTGGDAFITGLGKVVFNGNFHWAANGGEFGLNGDAPDVTFTTLSSDIPGFPLGLNIINLHGGTTVRNGKTNTFGEPTDLWARTGTNTYSLEGFSETLEFLGSNAGTNLLVKFGSTSGANALNWAASHNMSGDYQVQEFEIGLDSMQLGAAGPQFFTDQQLARITINGIPYSASDPGNGSTYWNRDANRFVQFHNVVVPEPSSLALVCLGLVAAAAQGLRRRDRNE